MKTTDTLPKFLALAGSSLIAISSASAQSTSNTWNTDADGNWTDPLNWLGDTNYAGGTDNTATFGNFISLDRIVTLNAPITIGNIIASDTTHNYAISGANTLTLDRTTGVPTIDVTTTNRTLTISSDIAGTDGLQKNGTGNLTISGAVNLSGGLVVNGGNLRLSSASNVITGGFTLNGGTLGNANGAGDITTATLNNNQITVNGAARIGIAAGSTTDGGITLNTGSVLTMGVTNSSATINGAVTGSGALIIDRTGLGSTTLSFNSTANTFTGAITLTVSGTRSLSVNSLADSATLGAGNISLGAGTNSNTNHTFALGSGAIAPVTLNNRQFEIATGTQVSAIAISNNSSQAFTVNTDLIVSASATGNRTLTFSGTGAGLSSFNGDIGNGALTTLGVTKTGSGTWVLGGDNNYNGNTTVSAGTLLINGNSSTALGAVTVAAAGTIGGVGTVGGNTALNGTLSPGQSPGTLTFAGDLAVNNGSTYLFEGGDLTNINGTLDLNNNWTLALGTGFQDGGTVTIFNFGTLAVDPDLDPTFNMASLGFTPGGALSLSAVGNSIVLNGISAIPEPSAALLGGLGLLALLRRRR